MVGKAQGKKVAVKPTITGAKSPVAQPVVNSVGQKKSLLQRIDVSLKDRIGGLATGAEDAIGNGKS